MIHFAHAAPAFSLLQIGLRGLTTFGTKRLRGVWVFDWFKEGRTVRWEPVNEVRNVRIVGDVSSVEVFVNDGALVFSTRIYPEAHGVTVDASGASVTYHTLDI